MAIEGNSYTHEEPRYYWVSLYTGMFEEAMTDFDYDAYTVSEEEHRDNYTEFIHQSTNGRKVNYDDMVPYPAEDFRAERTKFSK